MNKLRSIAVKLSYYISRVSMVRRKKFIIGGLTAFLALGYLVYVLLGSSVTYYSTVSELIESGESAYNKGVRVNGDVDSSPIILNASNSTLSFTITDGHNSIPVVYEGIDVPSGFGNQTQVVLEGKLSSTGIFHAVIILTKCPSKYEAEE